MKANEPIEATVLRQWRTARGLSQSQAAAKVGVPTRTWVNWERGRRRPQAAARALLAAVMMDNNEQTKGEQ